MRSSPPATLALAVAAVASCSRPGATESGRPRQNAEPIPSETNQTASNVRPPRPGEIARLGLDPFYEKSIWVSGVPIVASSNVSDYALLEAAYLTERMLEHRPDVMRALVASKMLIAIIGHTERTTDVPANRHLRPAAFWNYRGRGFGPSPESNTTTTSEEDLLAFPGRVNGDESIFVHELAHGIAMRGITAVDHTFEKRLKVAMDQAIARGLWEGTYAATHVDEYWAEGVQAWFNAQHPPDAEHNDIDSREKLKTYDEGLAALLTEFHGDGSWRYTSPAARAGRKHLRGFNPNESPSFDRRAIIAEYEVFRRGDGRQWAREIPVQDLAGSRSPASTHFFELLVINDRPEPLTVHWIDTEGAEGDSLGTVLPHMATPFSRMGAGHIFVVRDTARLPIAAFEGPAARGRFRIR